MQDEQRGINWISLDIKNDGKRSFKATELSWHIFLPLKLKGQPIDGAGNSLIGNLPFEKMGESRIEGEKYSHLTDNIKIASHPGVEIGTFYFQMYENYNPEQIEIRYFFSTEFGSRPKWVWSTWRFRKVVDERGFPRLPLLPRAEIRDIRNTNYRGTSFLPPEEQSGRSF